MYSTGGQLFHRYALLSAAVLSAAVRTLAARSSSMIDAAALEIATCLFPAARCSTERWRPTPSHKHSFKGGYIPSCCGAEVHSALLLGLFPSTWLGGGGDVARL